MAFRPSFQPTGNRVLRVPITIPGSGSNAENLQDLVVTALNTRGANLGSDEKPYIMGGRVNKVAAAYVGGDSAALVAAGTAVVTVAVGEVYEEPAVDFLESTWVRASGAGTIAAVVSVYLTGSR